ncbi:hypothetical protein WJX73_005252 [Symbiochloris irregularis]|uniref:Mitochondrial import receptor subunit TOM20 n=1 Tax=Symbiochloris irregularis TaxID=706552 RepID=A0AAW1Q0X2_9CHLO
MGELSRDDIDRLVFFEQAQEAAEREYAKNNNDIMAIIRWGGALLELAHFRQGEEAYDMIEQASEKFKQALRIDPKKHDALWCLGNAYTSKGFLSTDESVAHKCFADAADCFQKALKEDPKSEVYQKALEMTSKAPALYAELQRQLRASQEGTLASGGPLGGGGGGARPKASNEGWYDLAGWGIMVVAVIGILALARNSQPVAAGAALK